MTVTAATEECYELTLPMRRYRKNVGLLHGATWSFHNAVHQPTYKLAVTACVPAERVKGSSVESDDEFWGVCVFENTVDTGKLYFPIKRDRSVPQFCIFEQSEGHVYRFDDAGLRLAGPLLMNLYSMSEHRASKLLGSLFAALGALIPSALEMAGVKVPDGDEQADADSPSEDEPLAASA